MATVQALISIGVIIFSFITGFAFYYLISPGDKSHKLTHMQQVLSLLIDMVIFIWIGKVIMNVGQFIRDPIAVLAYPSDSSAFYFAIVIMLVYLAYKQKRNKLSIEPLITSFIPIFIVASFIFEFIQIIWFGNTWPYMALLMILIILYLLIYDKLSHYFTSALIVLGWSFGKLLLALILPFTTIFNYIIAPWFFIIVTILALLYVMYKRKKVSSWG